MVVALHALGALGLAYLAGDLGFGEHGRRGAGGWLCEFRDLVSHDYRCSLRVYSGQESEGVVFRE